ncbi:phosphoglucomutase [Bacteroidia bacterium]|nr:phosphoglucomutase [Bacteroidia bacterium]
MSTIDTNIIERATAWLSSSYDVQTQAQVKHLLQNDEKELVESFYQNLEFGTGGLRGIMGVGTNRMNKYTVGMATQGLANYLKKSFPTLPQIKVAISHDCRNNSAEFAQIVADVFSGNGFKVYLFESLRPTPELSFAIKELGCQSGVMVTASHNPKEYNGYKAYWSDGAQVNAPHDANIIEEVNKISDPSQVSFAGLPANIQKIGTNVDEIYLNKIMSLLALNPQVIAKQKDIKLVYTPLHGCGVKLVPEILKRLGFTNLIHVPEQDVNDGNFPTVQSPNPEEPTALKLAVDKALATGADVVMATDPDADRVGIAVRNGKGEFVLLNGNQTNSILTEYLFMRWQEAGKLKGKEFTVKTIVSTGLLDRIAAAFGVELFNCYTGFKYIAETAIREEAKGKTFIGGGEESFGFNIGSFVRDKDAIVTCGLIAEVAAWAKDQGKTLLDILLDIYVKYGYYKEKQISVVKKGKEGLEAIQQMMKDYRANPPKSFAGSPVKYYYDYQPLTKLDHKGRRAAVLDYPGPSNVLQYETEDGTMISVRPSGTEPKIKFYFSVREELPSVAQYAEVTEKLDQKNNVIARELGLQ